MAETVKPVRLADIVARRIETMILEGALHPGEKLLAERDLSERLGVSRPSLRDALDKLEDRGLLTTTRAGTFIAPFLAPFSGPLEALFSDDQRATADYFEYRAIMEANAAKLAASRLTEIDRAAIIACVARIHATHVEENPAAEAEADADLHVLIYEATHNVILLQIMRVISGMLRKDVFYNRERLYRRDGVRDALLQQHADIAGAILAGEPERAETAAAHHINYVYASIEEIRHGERRSEASKRRFDGKDLLAS